MMFSKGLVKLGSMQSHLKKTTSSPVALPGQAWMRARCDASWRVHQSRKKQQFLNPGGMS
jgi:hypothetical protein